MIHANDQKQIAQWERKNPTGHKIKIVRTPDFRSTDLSSFGEALSKTAAFITLSWDKEEDGFGYIEVDQRLRYHAVPKGQELSQFLAALTYVNAPPHLSDRIAGLVRQIDMPAHLMLFITPQCPHCPVLVRQIIPVVFSTSLISLTIVDGEMFPEMAKTYNVTSVPNLFLDNDFQWNGMVSVEELLKTMIQRDPAQLSSTSLKNLLTDGKAGLLADMMVRYGRIFPAFLSLLTHEKWPVRLGAMVTFEEIVRQNRCIARSVVAPLLDQFERMDDMVKGDIIYLFGLLHDKEMVPFLEKIEKGPYQDEIREAAAEALEELGIQNN